jgi:hypothetical protein
LEIWFAEEKSPSKKRSGLSSFDFSAETEEGVYRQAVSVVKAWGDSVMLDDPRTGERFDG